MIKLIRLIIAATLALKTEYGSAMASYADSREWRSITVRYWDTVMYLTPIP